MMKQAQKMAADVNKVQEELARANFEGSAGGGAVTATVTGDQRVAGVEIDADVFEGTLDAEDMEMLADAVTAAVNDALGKARAAQERALGPLAGGLGGLGPGP